MMCIRFFGFVVTGLMTIVSCTYPERAGDNSDIIGEQGQVVSIPYIKSFHKGYPYEFLDNYKVRGRVISDDRYGNVVNTLIMKDEFGVLEIKVDKQNLFESYAQGSLVELSCRNLSLGVVGGVVQMGERKEGSDFEVDYISELAFNGAIKKINDSDGRVSSENVEIINLIDSHLSCLISISGVMFEETDMQWCDKDDKGKFVDTDRVIIDRGGNRLLVRTARNSVFSDWIIPEGSGVIEGVLSKYAGVYRLRVINPGVLYTTMSLPRF